MLELFDILVDKEQICALYPVDYVSGDSYLRINIVLHNGVTIQAKFIPESFPEGDGYISWEFKDYLGEYYERITRNI